MSETTFASSETTQRDPRTWWELKAAVAMLILIVVVMATQPFLRGDHFEYRVISIPDEAFQPAMNAFGSDGWELVSARRASDGAEHPTFNYEVILKRRIGILPASNVHSDASALAKVLANAQYPETSK